MNPATAERSLDAERRAGYALRFGPQYTDVALDLWRANILRILEAARLDPKHGVLLWVIEQEIRIMDIAWTSEMAVSIVRNTMNDAVDDYHNGRL